MKQRRWLLSLLAALALLYYGLPRLSLTEGLPGTFALLWLAFAFVVIGGNLAALLYDTERRKQKTTLANPKTIRMKSRQYAR